MIESEVKAFAMAIAKANNHPSPDEYSENVFLNYKENTIDEVKQAAEVKTETPSK